MLLSLVIPIFNNAPLIGPFAAALNDRVLKWPFRTEIIFVDDASTDASHEMLEASAAKFSAPVCLIRLERNWGQSSAIVEGLKNASGDLALTFPIDMKENLSDVPNLVSDFTERGASIMQVVRMNRRYPSESRRLGSLVFNIVLKRLGLNISDIGSSLYAAKKAYYQTLIRPEFACFQKTLPVLIWKLSGAIPNVPLTDRSASQNPSSYSLRKLFRFAWEMTLAVLTPLAKSSEHPRNPVN